MRFREFMLVVAAASLSAAVATLPPVVLTLADIEDPWTTGIVFESLILTRMIFLVALAHALGLGLPTFFFLRSRNQVGVVSCAVGGFLIGAVPLGVLALISMFRLQTASSGGVPTVVNGMPMLAGLIEYA